MNPADTFNYVTIPGPCFFGTSCPFVPPMPVVTGTLPDRRTSSQALINNIVGDEISITDAWSLLAGVNWTEVVTQNFSAFTGAETSGYHRANLSPSASLIFKPLPNVSTYVTYMQGLEQGSVAANSFNFLPVTNRLIELLDAIDAPVRYRRVFPFGYVGLAVRHEEERIDEAIRDALPELLGSAAPDTGTWRSEREWIAIVSKEPEPASPIPVTLHIEVNDLNVAWPETASCDEIMSDVEERTAAVYASLPSISELCAIYGSPESRRVYTSRHEMDRMWLSRYVNATGHVQDLSLTQLGVD